MLDEMNCLLQTNEEDCREIVRVCKECNVLLTVCYVLRYTPWVKKIKEIIDSGAVGEVVNIQHLVPVSFILSPNKNRIMSSAIRNFISGSSNIN
jgi:predicted dehydrogenase